jgi:hypothetical protein
MKARPLIVSLVTAGALAIGLFPATNIAAQSVTASFTTKIYYQNPNNVSANAVINFYPEGGGTPDPVAVTLSNIPAFGSGEVWLGTVALNGGSAFTGSAVLSADQNIVAAESQIPTSNTTSQLMSTAFSSSDATTTLNLTTFLYNWGNAYSRFSVQNTESEPISYTARFFDLGNPVPIATVTGQIQTYSVKSFNAWISPTIGTAFINWLNTAGTGGIHGQFSGSVIVTATLQSSGQPAHIVGISDERYSSNDRGYAFSAIPQSDGATTVYVPTALCNYGGATTYFAVQNLNQSVSSDYTVTYYDTTGNSVGTQSVTSVGPGSKKSFNPCEVLSTLTGSAVVSGTQVAAVIGKAQDATNFTTAFIGKGTGSEKIAIPFVRFGMNTNELRSYLAIQNTGGSIPAGQITVTYYDTAGNVFRTCQTLAATGQSVKVNTNVSQDPNPVGGTMSCTGTAPTTSWSGSAIISGPSGSRLIAISRSQGYLNPKVTGDINGVSLP